MRSQVCCPSSRALSTSGLGTQATATSWLKEKGLLLGEPRGQRLGREDSVCNRTDSKCWWNRRVSERHTAGPGERSYQVTRWYPRCEWWTHQLSESVQKKQRPNIVLMLSRLQLGHREHGWNCLQRNTTAGFPRAGISPVHGFWLFRKQWPLSGDRHPSLWATGLSFPEHSFFPCSFVHPFIYSFLLCLLCLC